MSLACSQTVFGTSHWSIKQCQQYSVSIAKSIAIGEINTGSANVHAQFQFHLHSFDQNILIFENSLFSTIRKDLFRSWIFHYFPFTFYIQFILFAGKQASKIKRTFDQFTLVHSSLILNFIAEGHPWAGKKSAQIEFDCRRVSVIVHRSASDKLAAVHSSCLFGAESYSGQRERKSVWQGFQSNICELVSGKLSTCIYIYTAIRTL